MAYSSRTVLLTGFGAALIASLAYVAFRDDPIPVDFAEVTNGPLESPSTRMAEPRCVTFTRLRHRLPVRLCGLPLMWATR